MLSKREYNKLKKLKAAAIKKNERSVMFNALSMSITYVNEVLTDYESKKDKKNG